MKFKPFHKRYDCVNRLVNILYMDNPGTIIHFHFSIQIVSKPFEYFIELFFDVRVSETEVVKAEMYTGIYRF